MKTLHIKIKNEDAYHHLMGFLKKLDPNEVQFVEGKSNFTSIQDQLNEEIKAIDSGDSFLMELDEFDEQLEDLISKNED